MMKEKGITLIALAITIIILLILAGVTVATLTGDNGLLSKAGQAKEKNENANIEEQIKLAYLEYQTEKSTNFDITLENFMKTSLENIFNDTINVEKQGMSIKVTFLNDNKSYKYYPNGTVKELVNPTSVYAKLEGDTLKLKSTSTLNYKLYTSSSSINSNWNNDGTASKEFVKYIEIEDIISPTSLRNMFEGFSSLEHIKNIENLHTENVMSMWGTFSGCSSLSELNLSTFDTSKVDAMYGMFLGCSTLKNLNLDGWDTSNIYTMRMMFQNCTSLEKLDLGRYFAINNNTNTQYMFMNVPNTAKVRAYKDTIDIIIKLPYSRIIKSNCEIIN